MNEHPNETSGPDLEAPSHLVRDMCALHGEGPQVPRRVDGAILGMARRRLARRRRPVRVLRWAAMGAAAAAVLVVAVTLTVGPRREQAVAVAREDIDRSGTVDILDAFALARRIEAGPTPGREWDMNGDGAIDRKDVDVVAMAAVSLERGTLQ